MSQPILSPILSWNRLDSDRFKRVEEYQGTPPFHFIIYYASCFKTQNLKKNQIFGQILVTFKEVNAFREYLLRVASFQSIRVTTHSVATDNFFLTLTVVHSFSQGLPPYIHFKGKSKGYL